MPVAHQVEVSAVDRVAQELDVVAVEEGDAAAFHLQAADLIVEGVAGVVSFDDYTEPGAIAIKTRLAESIRRKASKEAPGFAYLGEEMVALAMADRHRNEYRALLEQAMFVLTHEVAFPGSDCYGEITVWGDYAGTGDLVSQQRTAIPHLWNGAVVYLAAIALYEPERLEYMRPPAP